MKYRVPHLWPTYIGEEDNICQSIWDKSEVLFGTFWETCENLGTLCLGTPPTPHKEKKGRSLSFHELLIGCMEIIFLKLAATILA